MTTYKFILQTTDNARLAGACHFTSDEEFVLILLNSLRFALLLSALMSETANSEWRFYAPREGAVILLSEETSRTKGCEGKKEASEQKRALEKWVFLRELCYDLDKAGNVKLTDPNKGDVPNVVEG